MNASYLNATVTVSNWLQLLDPLSATKMQSKIWFSAIYDMALFAKVSENDCINERHPLVSGDNMTSAAR